MARNTQKQVPTRFDGLTELVWTSDETCKHEAVKSMGDFVS